MSEEELKPRLYLKTIIEMRDMTIEMTRDEIIIDIDCSSIPLNLTPTELIELIKQLLRAYRYYHPEEKIEI
jgi:hypothetical protein